MKPAQSGRLETPADPATGRVHSLIVFGAAIGLVLPSIITWVYFVEAADYSSEAQRAIGLVTKCVQFAFPIAWIWFALRERISRPRGSFTGVPLGLLFGLVVTITGWIVFQHFLRDSPAFATALQPIRDKVGGFGLDSPAKYIALGAFYSLVHSLLEEYYWRWFVFGQLRRVLPTALAIVVSAIGFAAHHVIVLATFFGWTSWQTAAFSAAVAVGGGFWAWLYQRSGSLLGPWFSHLVIDAGIFVIGYELLRPMWN